MAILRVADTLTHVNFNRVHKIDSNSNSDSNCKAETLIETHQVYFLLYIFTKPGSK